MQVKVDLSEAPLVIPRQSPKEMITVRSVDGRTHVKINSSSLDVIQSCLRKSKLLLVDGWKPEFESPATLFGSAIHKAMEVYYAGNVTERKPASLDELEYAALNLDQKVTGLTERAVQAFAAKAAPLATLPDFDKRSIVNGVWILQNYFKAYIDDPFVVYRDEKGPFLEREFSFVIHEDDELVVEVFGTIDFAFRHVATGGIIPGDHKTTSSLSFNGSSYFDRERPNHQYTGYLMGAQKVFGIDSSDFLVNVIEVKAKPKTARGSAPNFPRQVTSRTKEDFEEYKEVILHNVRLFLAARETGAWPLGPVGSCNAYGSCNYKGVCAAPANLRQNILSAKFIKENQL